MAAVTAPTDATAAPDARDDVRFPTLTSAQIARVAAHGRRRSITRGEVLVEAGVPNVHFFVVVSGSIEVVRTANEVESIVTVHAPGQFTGEANMLTGRPSLVSIRAIEDGEVLDLMRDQLLLLVQTDAELSEIFMRAFILRRVALIAHEFGDG